MQVHDIPWESGKFIVWEKSTCHTPGQYVNPTIEDSVEDFTNDLIIGGHKEIKGDLNKEQQEVVDFIKGTFNANPKCTREIVSVDKFTEQVVAGTLYNVHLTTEGNPSNDASCGKINARTSCIIQVHDIPWESGKSIVWEKSTCHNPGLYVEPTTVDSVEGQYVNPATEDSVEVQYVNPTTEDSVEGQYVNPTTEDSVEG